MIVLPNMAEFLQGEALHGHMISWITVVATSRPSSGWPVQVNIHTFLLF